MASYSYGLAKGLREPCSPYRQAYFFGAELNEPSTAGWNCFPVLVGETHSFDLSTIPKGREVVVALLTIDDLPTGQISYKAEWYRNRDNALLYTYSGSRTVAAGGRLYFYSYIGYVDWEINENGGYRVELTVTRELSFYHVLQFTISGIPEPVEPEPVPVGFFPAIITALNTLSAFSYSAYVEVYYWVWPFNYLATPFYYGSEALSDLAWNFSDFAQAWYDVVDKLKSILNWDTVWSYILSYVPNLLEIRDWFYYWLDYVTQAIDNWWLSTQATVRGWIDATTDWAQLWINYLQGQVDELKVRLDNLILELPDITELLAGLSDLIDSAFVIRQGFWEGWQDWRDKVTEFFTDPEDWLYKSFDRIIERFW